MTSQHGIILNYCPELGFNSIKSNWSALKGQRLLSFKVEHMHGLLITTNGQDAAPRWLYKHTRGRWFTQSSGVTTPQRPCPGRTSSSTASSGIHWMISGDVISIVSNCFLSHTVERNEWWTTRNLIFSEFVDYLSTKHEMSEELAWVEIS